MDKLYAWQPKVLSILRIVAGLLFMEHGTMKWLHFPPGPGPDHLQLFSMMGIGGVLELVGGALIVVGLFTRPVAFILSGEMAVAYFTMHMPKSFFPAVNMGDAAILFCFVFLYLVFAGPGFWSIDAIVRKRP